MSADAIVVLITVPSPEVGAAIARSLVEERLAACVNLLPGVTSTFWWEGKVQTEPEALLVAKTLPALFQALAGHVRGLHPYTVPEIIALPLAAGNPAYLEWIRASLEGDPPSPGSP